MRRLTACLFALLAFQASASAAAPAAARSSVSSLVKFEMFFEAMDGLGWQEFFLADAVRKRFDGTEMKVYPLVIKNTDGKFEAKKGEAELSESMRLAVFNQSYPGKLLTYLNARSLSPWADGWRDAAIFCGIDPDELDKKTAAEGPGALAAAYERSQKAGVEAASLLINGKLYSGAQRLLPLLEAVNAVLPADKRVALPKSYTDRPKIPPPQLLVVLSSSPFSQKNDSLIGVFEKYFDDIKPQFLDYDSSERIGKIPKLDFVPAYVIEASSAARARLDSEIKAGIFHEVDGWLVYYDHQRKGIYPGRAKVENTLELFVMAYCPYGTQAENALLEAQKNGALPAGFKLEIHYIGDFDKKENGAYDFRSLHGQAEWEEDLRQLIIAKDFPDKFYAYLLERNKGIPAASWEDAATKAGISPKKVSDAFEDGKKMLADDFARSTALSIGTSPSFMWEGRTFMVGINELIKIPGFEKVALPGAGGAGCNK